MKKHLLLTMAVSIFAPSAFAQLTTPVVETANTTAAQVQATTATQPMSTAAGNTTATAFSAESFEQRWEKEAEMYREAGIAEEKIEQLRQLNQETWDARASGNRVDFQQLSRKRAAILTREEVQKLRDVRRQKIDSTLDSADKINKE